jgi:hypothetical protein
MMESSIQYREDGILREGKNDVTRRKTETEYLRRERLERGRERGGST